MRQILGASGGIAKLTIGKGLVARRRFRQGIRETGNALVKFESPTRLCALNFELHAYIFYATLQNERGRSRVYILADQFLSRRNYQLGLLTAAPTYAILHLQI